MHEWACYVAAVAAVSRHPGDTRLCGASKLGYAHTRCESVCAKYGAGGCARVHTRGLEGGTGGVKQRVCVCVCV